MTFQEPPIQPDDTQPRQGQSVPTVTPAPTLDPSWTTPLDTQDLLDAGTDMQRAGTPCLLSVVVIGITTCMCIAVIVMAAVAGYRDELDVIQTEEAADVRATSVVQYELALNDIEAGRWELASERLQFINERIANFEDTANLLQQAAIQLSQTPTPVMTNTPVPPSATPTLTMTPTPEISPTPTMSLIAQAFQDGENFYTTQRWEEAIEMLEIVKDLDPTYRPQDVDRMLFDAYNRQASLYFVGQNPVDERSPFTGYAGNQLTRGLTLYNKANEIFATNGAVGQYDDMDHYTAWFVGNFLNAQRYVDGGNYAAALPILEELCSPRGNCNWSYRGLSVQNLLDIARSG